MRHFQIKLIWGLILVVVLVQQGAIAGVLTAEQYCEAAVTAGQLPNEPALREAYIGALARSLPFAHAFTEAHTAFPVDPLKRGQKIVSLLKASKGAPNPADLIGINSDGEASYKGSRYPNISVDVAQALGNPMYATARATGRKRIPDNVEVYLIALHGQGAGYSHIGSLYYFIDLFERLDMLASQAPAALEGLTPRRSSFLSELYKRLLEKKLYKRITVEAIDLPGHGMGPAIEGFDLRQSVNWLKAHVLGARKALDKVGKQDVPIVLFGRSASPNLIAELVAKEAVCNRVVYMSPTPPELDPGFKDSFVGVIREDVRDGVYLNPIGLDWLLSMQPSFSYQNLPQPFGTLPTFIMVGGKDEQVPPQAARWYEDQASRFGNVHYRFDPERAHDNFRYPFEARHFGPLTYSVRASQRASFADVGRRQTIELVNEYPHRLANEDQRRSVQIYVDFFEWLGR